MPNITHDTTHISYALACATELQAVRRLCAALILEHHAGRVSRRILDKFEADYMDTMSDSERENLMMRIAVES